MALVGILSSVLIVAGVLAIGVGITIYYACPKWKYRKVAQSLMGLGGATILGGVILPVFGVFIFENTPFWWRLGWSVVLFFTLLFPALKLFWPQVRNDTY